MKEYDYDDELQEFADNSSGISIFLTLIGVCLVMAFLMGIHYCGKLVNKLWKSFPA